jgi:magnesium-transporting ATPase (P-type)
MNETKELRNEKKRKMFTILEIETREGKSRNISRPVFRLKYVEQALFFNRHFLMMIIVGVFGIIFTPLKTSINWINESIDFLNAVILGIGVGGVICWCFVYKFKKEFANEISHPVWMACYILLNICHILSVFFILGFFLSVGIKQNGGISSLACGVFFSMIYGIMLSIKYAYKS